MLTFSSRIIRGTVHGATLILPHIVNSFSFKDQHARRVKKFLYTFTSSENMLVLFIGERALRNTIGALGRNRARIEISSNVSKSNSDQITFSRRGCQWAHGSAWQCPANPWTHWCQGWNHGTQWFYIWWDILNNSGPLLWLEFRMLCVCFLLLNSDVKPVIDIYGICLVLLWWIICLSLSFFSQKLHSLCNAPISLYFVRINIIYNSTLTYLNIYIQVDCVLSGRH